MSTRSVVDRPKDVQRLLLNLPALLPDIADVSHLITYVERLEHAVHTAAVMAANPSDIRSYDDFITALKGGS